MSSGGSGGGSGEPSWAWLGLLKWSLQYSDGTAPTNTEDMKPMSAEDRAFLEQVIKEGVIDPASRMQSLLAHLTASLHELSSGGGPSTASNTEEITTAEMKEETRIDTTTPLDEDGMIDALEELRDIVEQIDAARDFVKMNGLPFLLGCASERHGVPPSIRLACLGVLCTLSQNNPPVQQALLDLDALSVLSSLYAAEDNDSDANGSMRAMLVQALSCAVRGHAVGEESFCRSEYGRSIVENGLTEGVPAKLRRKCTFFLRALLGSDGSSARRVQDFDICVRRVVDFLDVKAYQDGELRETSLGLLKRVLQQGHGVSVVTKEQEQIVGLGVPRVKQIRELEGEEKEFAQVELELWEGLMTELAKNKCNEEKEKKDGGGKEEKSSAPLLLGQ